MAAAPTPAWLRSRVRSSGWAQRAEAEIASRRATPRQLRRRLRDLDTIARLYARRVGDPVVLRDLDRARVALEDRLARYGHLSEGHGELMAAPRRRNVYPPFTTPLPAEMPLVSRLAAQLQDQTGLPLHSGQILEAPWIGRGTSRSTSEGWLRDANRFWDAYARQAPRFSALLGGGRRVTTAYADAMGWPRSTVGQQLVHHHILNSRYVVPLPARAHGAEVHRHATITGTPARGVIAPRPPAARRPRRRIIVRGPLPPRPAR